MVSVFWVRLFKRSIGKYSLIQITSLPLYGPNVTNFRPILLTQERGGFSSGTLKKGYEKPSHLIRVLNSTGIQAAYLTLNTRITIFN